MSSFDYLRKYQKLKVQKRSGFDKSFKNLLTTKVGTITPILVDELLPNTTVHLDAAINACLPPLASETFMNVNLEVCAFAVPIRLLYGGFEHWLTGEKLYTGNGVETSVSIPVLNVTSAVSTSVQYLGAGKLTDYLGYKCDPNDFTGSTMMASTNFNIFPLLAYHKIYDDWYRNNLIQKPVFRRPAQTGTLVGVAYTLPYCFISGSTPMALNLSSSLCDGVALGDLRQRNFDLDYFTSALPSAQKGNPQEVTMLVNSATCGTSFTIASLRAANSLQQFAERNQFSTRLVDYVKANYGANLSDGLAQRSMFLGRTLVSVYTRGVDKTQVGGDTASYNNPFGSVGATYGKAVCVGKGSLVDSFTAEEPMVLMVLATLVPKVTYSTGVNRMNWHYTSHASQVDMGNAALQNVGNQPIYVGELVSLRAVSANTKEVFGYTDRYAEYMTKEDELHGLVRDGQSLQSFAAQRSFAGTGSTQISDAFLKIPVTYLDQVAAASNNITQYGCWMDCYFNYKVSQPLAQYSIPSLQDPAYEHGKTVSIKKGGKSVY